MTAVAQTIANAQAVMAQLQCLTSRTGYNLSLPYACVLADRDSAISSAFLEVQGLVCYPGSFD